MNDSFRTETDQLTAHASQFDGHAAKAGRIHADLHDVLAQTDAAWGDDDAGRAFAETHTGAADDTVARLRALPDQLGDVRTRFTAAARTYDESEHTAVTGLSTVEQDG